MENKTIKVGISILSPFVIKTNYRYSGFEIDLWKEIANRLNIKYKYFRAPFNELIDGLKDGKYDIAFSGITINKSREQKFTFSHSYLNSGLLILSRKKAGRSIFTFISNNFWEELLKIFLFFVSTIFIFSNILWFFNKNNGIIDSSYIKGIIQAIYYTFSLISKSEFDFIIPQQYTGKIFILMIIAITILLITFHIIRIIIAIKRRNNKVYILEEIKDLENKRVATERDSTSEILLRSNNIKPITYKKIQTAFKKLKNNSIDAVLYDALPILYFLKNSKDDFKISKKLFEDQEYAIAINPESNLKADIDSQIVKMKSDGFFDFLYKKWFGNN